MRWANAANAVRKRGGWPDAQKSRPIRFCVPATCVMAIPGLSVLTPCRQEKKGQLPGIPCETVHGETTFRTQSPGKMDPGAAFSGLSGIPAARSGPECGQPPVPVGTCRGACGWVIARWRSQATLPARVPCVCVGAALERVSGSTDRLLAGQSQDHPPMLVGGDWNCVSCRR